eukprot:908865-Pelagomonas_calceolata.AAC.3
MQSLHACPHFPSFETCCTKCMRHPIGEQWSVKCRQSDTMPQQLGPLDLPPVLWKASLFP